VTLAEFERVVERALAGLPEELRRAMDNVAVIVEDEDDEDPDLYGLYRGTPLTERSSEGYAGSLPDTVTVYRRPLVADFGDDTGRLADEIRITVVHEVGHHFGLDEDELERLGWA
jgi:predicted Zn-dependent protease with MMP-like domain